MGKIKEELVTFGKAELTASCASVIDFGLAFSSQISSAFITDLPMRWE